MQVAFVLPPSRFPTVIHDPGSWWHLLASRGVDLRYSNANAAWWRALCDAGTLADTLAIADEADRQGLCRSALQAHSALLALKRRETFGNARRYAAAVDALAAHLHAIGDVQQDFTVDLLAGPILWHADYDDSLSLLECSVRDGIVAASMRALANEFAEVDLAAFKVSSPQDLLSAMILARLAREANPALHCCLMDHGFENFSLRSQMPALEDVGALAQAFDTIVRSKEDIAPVMVALCEALEQGERPRGFVGQIDMAPRRTPVEPLVAPPIGVESFCPEPVYWTRLSERRCYWGRCTYCVQNEKYESHSVPSKADLDASLAHIEALLDAGYRNFIFSDEAVSPATLRMFCEEIERRGLQFRWSCRAKLELRFTRELIGRIAQAGCYEILFGMETTSPATLKRMDKYVEGLDAERIKQILRDMAEQGIGVHVNLIAGFPYDTCDELRASVDFLVGALADMRNATCLINRFALFPGTPIARQPERYGIEQVDRHGDMQQRLPHRLEAVAAEQQREVVAELPRLRQLLLTALGWRDVQPGAAVLALYLATGHSAIFKAMPDNPLDATRYGPVEVAGAIS